MKVIRQQKYCLSMALLLLVCAAVTAGIYQTSKTLFPADFLWQCANVLLVGAVVCVLSWRHSHMAWNAFVESRDDEKSGVQENIFDNEADFSGRSERAFTQFNKIILPVVLIGISIFEIYLSLSVFIATPTKLTTETGSPLIAISVLFGIALLLFLAGKYSSGLAFDEKHHFLRPISASLLLGALTLFFGAIAGLAYHFEAPRIIGIFTTASCIFSFALAGERLLLWVVDLYRPKRKKDEYIPVYESRMLALFSQPRGVLGNLSSMLEYQFGVKISESSFASFANKILIPFVSIQLLSLFVLSSITYIQPHEEGVKLSWGSKEFEKLVPGLYITAPWPMCTVERFNVQRIQELKLSDRKKTIADEDEEAVEVPVVDIWQDQKYDAFVTLAGNTLQPGNPNLAVVDVRLKYKIADVLVYRSSYSESAQALKMFGRQAVNRALLENDFQALLKNGLLTFAEKLKKDIQETTGTKLGVEIVDVEILNFQPPSQVAEDYQAIYAANQDGRRLMTEAEIYSIKEVVGADIKADKTKKSADAQTVLQSMLREVELKVFKSQRDAYNKMPLIYVAMAKMTAIEQSITKVRKMVNLTGAEKEIIILELKKNAPDLLNLE